jgi:hypothetical protein
MIKAIINIGRQIVNLVYNYLPNKKNYKILHEKLDHNLYNMIFFLH